MLSLAAALERLGSPEVFERYSALTGEAIFAVDLAAESHWPDELALAVAREALAELPCPTVALAEEGLLSPAAEALVAGFDVRVASREELAAVSAAVARNPLASLALVQLLRASGGRSVHEGLVAESWVYSMLQAGPEFARWLAARPARRPAEPSGAPVRAERRDGLLAITLDRPEKRNAYSAAMRDALCEALALAVRDASIDRVQLAGAGPAFCSGGDLDEFGTTPDPATAHAVRCTRHPARWLHGLEGRCEALVHGACVGAGIELPAFAGRLRARADAWFQLPEVGMGLVPGAGGTVSLTRRIGRQRCAWLALSGQRLAVETALDWGLVDEIAS